IRAVAALGGVAIDLPERYFLAKFHHGKIPAWEGKDGFLLFDGARLLDTRGLNTLEKHIATRTFFVGERITIADVCIAATVQRACCINIDTAARATLPSLLRHMHTVLNQPALAHLFEPTPKLATAPVHVAP
ncbi:hypothetical protein B0H17DRAFT_1040511, partial [Mycena rosella]